MENLIFYTLYYQVSTIGFKLVHNNVVSPYNGKSSWSYVNANVKLKKKPYPNRVYGSLHIIYTYVNDWFKVLVEINRGIKTKKYCKYWSRNISIFWSLSIFLCKCIFEHNFKCMMNYCAQERWTLLDDNVISHRIFIFRQFFI